MDRLFDELDTDKSGNISRAELLAALGKQGMQAGLKQILDSLLPAGGASAGQTAITRDAFCKTLEKLPRVRGELVSWTRSLRLEEHLARLISCSRNGDLLDGLKGLKAPQLEDGQLESFVQGVADDFSALLRGVLLAGLRELRSLSGGACEAKAHVNSKFSLDGAFVGQFATLDDFHSGPEKLIGSPNPKVMEGMETEHCRRPNAGVAFTTPNYNVTTTPREEWEFVVCPVEGKAYQHTPKDRAQWPVGNKWKGDVGREVEKLEKVMAMEEVKRAGLKEAEVVGLRMYTGPAFILYNARLRGFPAWVLELLHGNDYETTIFIIASGITKLAKVTPVPSNRLVYRGCGGMILPRNFWEDYDECQATLSISAVSADLLTRQDLVKVLKDRCTAPAATTVPVATAAAELGDSTAAAAARGDKASAFDLGIIYLPLVLDPGGEAAERLLAGKPGIRVVKGPCAAGGGSGGLQLVVALPLSELDLTDSLKEELVAAVVVACGGGVLVRVEQVANKPKDFKGGGDPATPPPLESRYV